MEAEVFNPSTWGEKLIEIEVGEQRPFITKQKKECRRAVKYLHDTTELRFKTKTMKTSDKKEIGLTVKRIK